VLEGKDVGFGFEEPEAHGAANLAWPAAGASAVQSLQLSDFAPEQVWLRLTA
jgi:hypothetical protein